MMDYDSLNLLCKNNIAYTKKFNFEKKLKNYSKVLLKNIRDIENIKLTGCKISDASNWLLDNFFSLENAFNVSEVFKSKKYKSIKFNNEFLPRTYLFCLCFIENQRSLFDGNEFSSRLGEYEENIKLSLDEISDIPFFVNYTILEKICEFTNEILIIEKEKLRVYDLFIKISKFIKLNKSKMAFKNISKYFENNFSLCSLGYFLNLIKENRINDVLINDFLNRILENEKLTNEELKNINSKKLNKIRINISMYIRSLKNVSLFDWKECLENVSSTHREFLKDPSCIYPRMDYDSREFYRKTFYDLCRKNNLDESIECTRIINMCKEGASHYSRHVGYYILDEGVKRLTNRNKCNSLKKMIYFASIISGSILFPLVLFIYADISIDNLYLYIFVGIIFLILSSDIFVNFTNYWFSKITNVKFIPKMDYSHSIPDEAKTIVVIPSMLSSKEDIDRLFKNLEISYICNMENNLYFSLLLDYVDTISFEGSEDKILLNYAKDCLNRLNKKYENKNSDTKFYMFVREKVYNESNKVYMGWERKRGKIMEFIKFLKGEETNFKYSIENYKSLNNAKYIITIDSDSKLMKGSAWKLVGTIHHALNRAVVKNFKNRNRVVRGYGIVQPKVKISFKSSINTFYSKIFAGSTSTSSYNSLVSNIYQEVFGDSIFMGKGIIDIDVFHKVLRNSIPENKILSHDLIEGCFTKVLFSSDIEIEESFPSNVLSSFSRLHRWIRGDWQLTHYLFKPRGINLLSKYKILDNLRRSLVPICYIVAFLIPAIINVNQKNIYYGLVFLSLIYPIILDISSLSTVPICRDSIFYGMRNLKDKFVQIYLMFSFLPYQSYICIDAIIKVLFRMIFTKRNLLEWKSFQETERESSKYLFTYIGKMFPCVVFGILYLGLGFYSRVYSNVLISFAFMFAPILAYFLSKKFKVRNISMKSEENIFLRAVSRSIFSYFEDFVNDSTNYLVCDNYQEDPYIGIAKRTSPTNIGMSLNAFSLGRDFGFISVLNTIEILNKIISSVDILPTYRGHLYNWYDIEKAVPLGNRFISTVDSGNLLASYHLCKKSLEDVLNTPLIHKDLVKSFEEIAYLSSGFTMEHSYKDAIDYGYTCSKYSDYIKFLEKVVEDSRKNISEIGEDKIDMYWHIKINESANNFLNEILNITCRLHEIPNFKVDNFGEIFINTSISCLGNSILDFIESYNNSSVRDENVHLKMCEVLDNVATLVKDIEILIESINSKINNMDFKFLYNKNRNLLSIGYDCENDILDDNCYDMLASESRIASFLSIAKGDIPIKHWFSLGRAGVKIKENRTLLSWSGTMFEYLMPMLYMRAYPDTLLHETYKGCVDSQIDFGRVNKIPFGISESCFYEFDGELNYQYRAFGVPYVCVNKDCSNLVVSPYSSIMSSMVDFESSIKNLKSLRDIGCIGKYGFYESIDFTKSRLEDGEDNRIVRNYMAHHQGMSLMALSNILIDNVCQNRFESIVEVQSISELLNESIENINMSSVIDKSFDINNIGLNDEFKPRVIKYASDKICDVQIYSNGEYSLGISSSGGGFLKFKDRDISSISRDFTNEKAYGCIYINDFDNRKIFSSTYLPCKNNEVDYTCEFGIDKAKFIADYNDLRIISEILVSSDDNVEVRKVLVKNLTSKPKNLDVCSYFESENVNRNFEYVNENLIGVCSDEKNEIFMAHSVFFKGDKVKEIEFENQKERFIGINGDLENPIFTYGKIFHRDGKFNLVNVLSARCNILVEPYGHETLYFINSIAYSKEEAICLINKYKNLNLLLNLSENNSYNFKSRVNSLGISSLELIFFNYITSKILYGDFSNEWRLSSGITINDLISHNIDPLIPMVSIEVTKNSDMENLELLLKLFLYFSGAGLNFNLVVLNGYLRYDKKLDREIENLILKYGLKEKINVRNGIYIILSNLYKNTYELAKSISNIFIKSSGDHIYDQLGFSLKDVNCYDKQLDSENWLVKVSDSFEQVVENVNFNNYLFETSNEIWGFSDIDKYTIPKKDLKFYNSYGGFSKDLRYVIKLSDFNIIPYSYRNVLGNKYISTCVLSNGFMSTWAFDCGEFHLTERFEDDKASHAGECIYIKEGSFVWSPTLNPISNGEDYIVSNSYFSTKIENKINDIKSEVECFVPKDKKYKVVKIKFKNLSNRVRSLNISYFAPISMTSKSDYSKKLRTDINNDFNYIYGENIFSMRFRNVKSYLKSFGLEEVSFTGSKKEFLGINRGYSNPSGIYKEGLSNLTGINIESCLSTQGKIILDSESTKEIYIVFGYDNSIDGINLELKEFSRNYNLFSELYDETKSGDEYKSIQVKTDDFHLDVFMNKWILHQNENEKFLVSSSERGELNSVTHLMEQCLIYNYTSPIESKKNIIKVFSNIYEDGKFKDRWSNLTKEYTINDSLYDGLWILFIFIDYIKITGDLEILNFKIKLMNENDSELRSSTIHDKIMSILKRGIEFDNLKSPRLSKDIVDLKTIFMMYKILGEFLEIFEINDDNKSFNIFNKVREDILNIIPKYFNGEFYLDNLNKESIGTISLKTQALYLICVKDGINKEKVLNSIDKYLVSRECEFVRESFTNNLSNRNNEVWVQDSRDLILFIKALAHLKFNNAAYRYLNFLNPVLKTIDRNHANSYRREPYFIPCKIEFRGNELVRTLNEDFNYVSSIFYRVVIQDILGFKICEGGFYIDPCVPDDWSSYTFLYFRGCCEYKIIVRKGESRITKINGEKCVENFIKFRNKGKFIIDVTV